MRCPRCGVDVPEDSRSCPECKATLMSAAPDDASDIVPVFVTNDASALAIAKSLLDAEGIECEIQGESGREMLGLGPFPGATGPMRIMVMRKDEEAARGLLAQEDVPADPDA